MVEKKVREGVAIYEEGCGMWVGIEEGEGVRGSLRVCAGEGWEISDCVNVLGAGDEFGGDGDTAGSFHLVTCKHPDFYAGVAEEFEGGFDVLLEFVFNASNAKEFEIVLEMFSNDMSHVGVAGL